jgi:hypothetical protein
VIALDSVTSNSINTLQVRVKFVAGILPKQSTTILAHRAALDKACIMLRCAATSAREELNETIATLLSQLQSLRSCTERRDQSYLSSHHHNFQLRRVLGHTQPSTTYRYVNASVETACRASSALDAFNAEGAMIEADEAQSQMVN